MNTWIIVTPETELYHHGIKGQRWGVRRFQNEDGSLTAAGRDRYGTKIDKLNSKWESYSEKASTGRSRIAKAINADNAARTAAKNSKSRIPKF